MIKDNQVYLLTGEQLFEFGAQIVQQTIAAMKGGAQSPADNSGCDPNKFVHGLRGIMELFNVSHTQAQQYKNTFLQPAVSQRGRKIMVDRVKAIELFNIHRPNKAINQ